MNASTAFPPGTAPKQILALDGGGVRGIVSVAFIERMEALLAEHPAYGPSARLHDIFDLVGGTSTGGIIGTAIALGMSTGDIKDFYFRLAPRVFRKSVFRFWGIRPVFDSRALSEEIKGKFGGTTLDTDDLRTALAIVMKRMDTGSAWIVTNNPRAKYWEDPEDGSFIGNRHYRLADLVRSSTAAPYYFAPEKIFIVDGEPPGLFVDGGMTPHNNPALALLQVATIPAYGFGWQTGADNLRIISIGTGEFSNRLSFETSRKMPAVALALEALKGLVTESSVQVMTLMQVLGRTDTPWYINSEIGDLHDVLLPKEPLFTFQRYDINLDRAWLQNELGASLTAEKVERLKQLDDVENVPLLYELGQAAAEKFMKAEHIFPQHDTTQQK